MSSRKHPKLRNKQQLEKTKISSLIKSPKVLLEKVTYPVEKPSIKKKIATNSTDLDSDTISNSDTIEPKSLRNRSIVCESSHKVGNTFNNKKKITISDTSNYLDKLTKNSNNVKSDNAKTELIKSRNDAEKEQSRNTKEKLTSLVTPNSSDNKSTDKNNHNTSRSLRNKLRTSKELCQDQELLNSEKNTLSNTTKCSDNDSTCQSNHVTPRNLRRKLNAKENNEKEIFSCVKGKVIKSNISLDSKSVDEKSKLLTETLKDKPRISKASELTSKINSSLKVKERLKRTREADCDSSLDEERPRKRKSLENLGNREKYRLLPIVLLERLPIKSASQKSPKQEDLILNQSKSFENDSCPKSSFSVKSSKIKKKRKNFNQTQDKEILQSDGQEPSKSRIVPDEQKLFNNSIKDTNVIAEELFTNVIMKEQINCESQCSKEDLETIESQMEVENILSDNLLTNCSAPENTNEIEINKNDLIVEQTHQSDTVKGDERINTIDLITNNENSRINENERNANDDPSSNSMNNELSNETEAEESPETRTNEIDNTLYENEESEEIIIYTNDGAKVIYNNGKYDDIRECILTDEVESEENNENLLLDEKESEENNENLLLDEKESEDNNENLLLDEKESEENNENLLLDEKESEENNENLLLDETESEENNENLLLDETESEENDENLLLDETECEENNENLLLDETESEENNENLLLDEKESEEIIIYTDKIESEENNENLLLDEKESEEIIIYTNFGGEIKSKVISNKADSEYVANEGDSTASDIQRIKSNEIADIKDIENTKVMVNHNKTNIDENSSESTKIEIKKVGIAKYTLDSVGSRINEKICPKIDKENIKFSSPNKNERAGSITIASDIAKCTNDKVNEKCSYKNKTHNKADDVPTVQENPTSDVNIINELIIINEEPTVEENVKSDINIINEVHKNKMNSSSKKSIHGQKLPGKIFVKDNGMKLLKKNKVVETLDIADEIMDSHDSIVNKIQKNNNKTTNQNLKNSEKIRDLKPPATKELNNHIPINTSFANLKGTKNKDEQVPQIYKTDSEKHSFSKDEGKSSILKPFPEKIQSINSSGKKDIEKNSESKKSLPALEIVPDKVTNEFKNYIPMNKCSTNLKEAKNRDVPFNEITDKEAVQFSKNDNENDSFYKDDGKLSNLKPFPGEIQSALNNYDKQDLEKTKENKKSVPALKIAQDNDSNELKNIVLTNKCLTNLKGSKIIDISSTQTVDEAVQISKNDNDNDSFNKDEGKSSNLKPLSGEIQSAVNHDDKQDLEESKESKKSLTALESFPRQLQSIINDSDKKELDTNNENQMCISGLETIQDEAMEECENEVPMNKHSTNLKEEKNRDEEAVKISENDDENHSFHKDDKSSNLKPFSEVQSVKNDSDNKDLENIKANKKSLSELDTIHDKAPQELGNCVQNSKSSTNLTETINEANSELNNQVEVNECLTNKADAEVEIAEVLTTNEDNENESINTNISRDSPKLLSSEIQSENKDCSSETQNKESLFESEIVKSKDSAEMNITDNHAVINDSGGAEENESKSVSSKLIEDNNSEGLNNDLSKKNYLSRNIEDNENIVELMVTEENSISTDNKIEDKKEQLITSATMNQQIESNVIHTDNQKMDDLSGNKEESLDKTEIHESEAINIGENKNDSDTVIDKSGESNNLSSPKSTLTQAQSDISSDKDIEKSNDNTISNEWSSSIKTINEDKDDVIVNIPEESLVDQNNGNIDDDNLMTSPKLMAENVPNTNGDNITNITEENIKPYISANKKPNKTGLIIKEIISVSPMSETADKTELILKQIMSGTSLGMNENNYSKIQQNLDCETKIVKCNVDASTDAVKQNIVPIKNMCNDIDENRSSSNEPMLIQEQKTDSTSDANEMLVDETSDNEYSYLKVEDNNRDIVQIDIAEESNMIDVSANNSAAEDIRESHNTEPMQEDVSDTSSDIIQIDIADESDIELCNNSTSGDIKKSNNAESMQEDISDESSDDECIIRDVSINDEIEIEDEFKVETSTNLSQANSTNNDRQRAPSVREPVEKRRSDSYTDEGVSDVDMSTEKSSSNKRNVRKRPDVKPAGTTSAKAVNDAGNKAGSIFISLKDAYEKITADINTGSFESYYFNIGNNLSCSDKIPELLHISDSSDDEVTIIEDDDLSIIESQPSAPRTTVADRDNSTSDGKDSKKRYELRVERRTIKRLIEVDSGDEVSTEVREAIKRTVLKSGRVPKENPQKCPKCSKVYFGNDNMRKHSKWCGVKPFLACPLCPGTSDASCASGAPSTSCATGVSRVPGASGASGAFGAPGASSKSGTSGVPSAPSASSASSSSSQTLYKHKRSLLSHIQSRHQERIREADGSQMIYDILSKANQTAKTIEPEPGIAISLPKEAIGKSSSKILQEPVKSGQSSLPIRAPEPPSLNVPRRPITAPSTSVTRRTITAPSTSVSRRTITAPSTSVSRRTITAPSTTVSRRPNLITWANYSNRETRTRSLSRLKLINQRDRVLISIPQYIKLYCQGCGRTYGDVPASYKKLCEICRLPLQADCEMCKAKAFSIQWLGVHLTSMCKGTTLQECPHCKHTSNNKSSMQEHIIRRHAYIDPEDFVPCPKCDRMFRLHVSMLKHARYCGRTKDLYCQFCPFKTKHRSVIKVHHQQHAINCTEDEMKSRFGKGPRSIPERGKKFHKLMKESDKFVQKYLTATCSSCFLPSDMKNSRYQCAFCSSPLSYTCERCFRNRDRLYSMRVHVLRVHAEKLFKCSNCDKSYGFWRDLDDHMERCGKLPSHVCRYCDFVTYYKKNLTQHMKQRHDKVSEMSRCHKCGKVFASKSTLSRHVNHFCGIEPRLRCAHCSFKTRAKFSLTRHIQSIHAHLFENCQFHCEYCGEKFLRIYLFENHIIKCRNETLYRNMVIVG